MKLKWNAKRLGKGAALVGTVALCLALTGCYIPPDEITDDTESMTVGGNNLPFDTFDTAVPSTEVPTATPTTEQSASQPTINWEDWGTEATDTAAPTGASTVAVVTSAPTGASTIVVITQQPTDTPAPTTTSLKKGSSGSSVRQVQQRLKTLGYLTGSADGDFGDVTEAAVIAFQQANGLTADGVVGTKTLEKLNSNSAIAYANTSVTVKPTATATPKVTNTPAPTATPKVENVYLQVGSSGTKVKTLQQRLISLGWMAGTADGTYGGATQAAVKAFQEKSGLWADGIAGPDTLALLYSSSAKSSSSPVSSIGETLEEGMSGNAVRAMQKRLKELGYLSGSADGDFGSATKEAVIAFQRNNNLTADGKAGTATLNKLYQEETTSSSSSSADDTDSDVSSTGYVVLKEGSTGDAVKKLQQALKQLGYYSGSVDGTYGSGTTSAVQAFQRANDLTVDGAAGPATQRALYGTGSSITYSTLRTGDSGSAVKNLQYALYELGYYDGSLDGSYGATTSDAVRAFQIQNSITPVDGIAGNVTLQKLYSSSAKAAATATSEYETLQEGSKGSEVVEMQECLVQLGYLADVTGVYDSATTAAVKAFQKANGLSADGVAGNATLQKLYSGSAK